MSSPIRLILVDDHPAIRFGLVSMLGLHPEFQIVAEASTGDEALHLHRTSCPDLTLMDVRLPGMDGIQTLSAIRAEHEQARIIMLSSEALEADVFRSMEAGACVYLLKTSTDEHFAAELHHAHQHGWCQPFTPQARQAVRDMLPRLTPRELEVLTCLRRGLSNADIGKVLHISPETAISHVKTLLVKLNVANRTEAVSLGYETGLLRIEGKQQPGVRSWPQRAKVAKSDA
jgi:DNA-binding NarL/FixJ family response regulator